MLNNIRFGDITDPHTNPGDIIIAMNTELSEVSALGRPFIKNIAALDELELGSVLTFSFDHQRHLHMLICHRLGLGGWVDSEKYVRYCLDYLWQQHRGRQYAAVQIGNGQIGQRDGANVSEIRTAMATSFLELDLVIMPQALEAQVAVDHPSLGAPFRIWNMGKGEREIQVSA